VLHTHARIKQQCSLLPGNQERTHVNVDIAAALIPSYAFDRRPLDESRARSITVLCRHNSARRVLVIRALRHECSLKFCRRCPPPRLRVCRRCPALHTPRSPQLLYSGNQVLAVAEACDAHLPTPIIPSPLVSPRLSRPYAYSVPYAHTRVLVYPPACLWLLVLSPLTLSTLHDSATDARLRLQHALRQACCNRTQFVRQLAAMRRGDGIRRSDAARLPAHTAVMSRGALPGSQLQHTCAAHPAEVRVLVAPQLRWQAYSSCSASAAPHQPMCPFTSMTAVQQ